MTMASETMFYAWEGDDPEVEVGQNDRSPRIVRVSIETKGARIALSTNDAVFLAALRDGAAKALTLHRLAEKARGISEGVRVCATVSGRVFTGTVLDGPQEIDGERCWGVRWDDGTEEGVAEAELGIMSAPAGSEVAA